MAMPYMDGYRAGRLDRWIGARSEYAWAGMVDRAGSYRQEYGRGYRAGWERGTLPPAPVAPAPVAPAPVAPTPTPAPVDGP